MVDKSSALDFGSLVSSIKQVHDCCAAQASKAVNISLTLRNWAIGCYLREYEQHGADRAQYGERLLDQLAERLREEGMSRVESRELRRYRQFYMVYNRIRESLTPELQVLFPGIALPAPEIRESLTPESAVMAGRWLLACPSLTWPSWSPLTTPSSAPSTRSNASWVTGRYAS